MNFKSKNKCLIQKVCEIRQEQKLGNLIDLMLFHYKINKYFFCSYILFSFFVFFFQIAITNKGRKRFQSQLNIRHICIYLFTFLYFQLLISIEYGIIALGVY